MRKFFTPYLFLLAALFSIGNASAQTVIEAVLIDEDFDDASLDPNLFIGNYDFGSLRNNYQGSQYWEVNIAVLNSPNFSLFGLGRDFLSGYDSILVTFDFVKTYPNLNINCSGGILDVSASTFQDFPMHNLQIGMHASFLFDNTYYCNESLNTKNLIKLDNTYQWIVPIISGYKYESLAVWGNFPEGKVCESRMCVCDILYPDDDMIHNQCISDLSINNFQSPIALGIDNLKIIGYKTDVTTGLTNKNTESKTLVMVTNILGQEVKHQNSGEIYLYHYANGDVEKRMIIK
jgi:hypothetical protein